MQESDKKNNVCLPADTPSLWDLHFLEVDFLFSICLRASAFEADRETIYKLVLDVAERRHLELAPAHGAWSSLQFPQSSQGPSPGPPAQVWGNLPAGLGPVLFLALFVQLGDGQGLSGVECSNSAPGPSDLFHAASSSILGVTHACPSSHLWPSSRSFLPVLRFEN